MPTAPHSLQDILNARKNLPPPPQKPTIYTGPATPAAYDPDWQHFTNLTADQIAAFKAFPEWAAKIAAENAWRQTKGLPPVSAT